MLVQVEAVGRDADGRATVRVRSEMGAAAAFWGGGPTGVGREHHVEWTVEEDVSWGRQHSAGHFLLTRGG